MSVLKILKHLFLPHDSNNQKAKILHTDSLYFLIAFLIGFQLLLNKVPSVLPSVLGYASSISASEVINLTNKERSNAGLSSLTENRMLDSAALAKGQDMLAKGYWAHFAPDGTSPWSFFTGFGYKYQFAGENLARDFSNAQNAVSAWMNSPTHKENILNSRYKEIGIGIVEGNLGGVETTIIVQFFGTPLGGAPAISVAKAEDVAKAPVKVPEKITFVISTPLPSFSPVPSSTPQNIVLKTVAQHKVSPFSSTKNISVGLVGGLLLVLSIDLIIVRRKKIVRIGGRTLAHIAYLSMILAVILLLKAGQII